MMMVFRLVLLIFAINGAVTTAAEEEVPNCKYTTYGQIVPADEPCMCSKETTCNPNELCVNNPANEEAIAILFDDDNDFDFSNSTTIESIFATGLLECYAWPCDDLSGRWIWYGRNPRPWIQGDFTVWSTVEIEQDNCQFILTSSSNVIGSDGLLISSDGDDEIIQTRKYYGVLVPMELTSFYLFDAQEDIMNQYLSAGEDGVDQDGVYLFIQDFGNGAPRVQCSLFGSLLYKGFASNTLSDDVDAFSGTLARDVEGIFSIGDTIAAEGDWDSNGGCPEGYPKPWGLTGDGGSSSLEEVKCCNPETGPGGCPDENGSFDNCWDEGGYCCSDGNWYPDDGAGGNNCQDNQLDDSQACTTSSSEPMSGGSSGCLVGDIMYSEGDSIGHSGMECIDDTTYDGTESRCGPDGTVVEEELTFTCPNTVPYCVQCGPRGRGNALCLSTPTTDRDCGKGDSGGSSGCLVGDIMYSEGDSIGHIGLECIDDTTYDGTESRCGPDGTIVEEELTFTCPNTVPYCVQCGPRGRGNALCLSTPTTDRDCGEVDNNLETNNPIVCADGQDPIPETFCGRGPDRADCGDDEYCFIHPADHFAVCCPYPDHCCDRGLTMGMGNYCCSDGNWYTVDGSGGGNCQDKQLEASQACPFIEGEGPNNTPTGASSPSPTSNAAFCWQCTPNNALSILKLVVATTVVVLLL